MPSRWPLASIRVVSSTGNVRPSLPRSQRSETTVFPERSSSKRGGAASRSPRTAKSENGRPSISPRE